MGRCGYERVLDRILRRRGIGGCGHDDRWPGAVVAAQSNGGDGMTWATWAIGVLIWLGIDMAFVALMVRKATLGEEKR